MCFFGFLHCREVLTSDASFDTQVHSSLADVHVDSHVIPSFVAINIKASKTDPFCQGVKVCLGTTAKDLCPVGASYTTWP